MCLCVLEIPVCCLVAAVASEVRSVCVWREGGRGSEGEWREREEEGGREGGVYLRVQYAILFQR